MAEPIALKFLFLAYLVAFLIIVGFVARTMMTTRRLEAEVDRLRQELAPRQEDAHPVEGGGGPPPANRASS